jgi:membrane-anchored protein YejM (alkaline phosphatase superfamily)
VVAIIRLHLNIMGIRSALRSLFNRRPADAAVNVIVPVAAFYAWAYIATLAISLTFVMRVSPRSPRAWGFGIAVALTYAALYTLPTLAVLLMGKFFPSRHPLASHGAVALAVAVTSATQLLLGADYVIHGMFGFHINGFVINLITTPEGIASMGADVGAMRVYGSLAILCLIINATIAWWLRRGKAGRVIGAALAGRPLKWAVLMIVVLAVGERIAYGVGHIQARPDIMAVAAAVPGYQPTTFRSLAKRFGIEMQRRANLDAPGANATLVYPSKPLDVTPPAKPMNIVWLVCESLRADMLTPEIMPRTWAFAQENQRFTRHYSGGNGTRMGMFTVFYGLPGNYWFNVLANRRSPVLIDRVRQLGYRLYLSTSAAFSYPEFDKTLFSQVPAGDLYSMNKGEGWEKDRHHVARIKGRLAQDDGRAPFFLFHFFESPHARYYFPPESVIRRPYLEEFNYATADVKRDIELIRNRYINAVHHLDSQLGEVIDALRAKNLLDNTLIMITGDHGEEFMETGWWGHNSDFTESQVRVPLVLHVPGRAPALFEHRTSHVDLVPTVLPMLGIKNPPSDYCTGDELFSTSSRLLTFADWDRIALSDGHLKAVFPLKAGGEINSRVTTAEDHPVEDEGAALKQMGAPMAELMRMMSRFTKKS